MYSLKIQHTSDFFSKMPVAWFCFLDLTDTVHERAKNEYMNAPKEIGATGDL